ncbi:PI-PLC X domain-containing protein 1-like [Nilaparvata lugens]|uniref:PI-PLC X domain-containing protein 1-like n=1 Tax=Nilaparvata lugens TaxID=108931 RepID=UPI00193CC29F|nr:PI-PLC X domain-containing protein 1-like [Nilaparvata lugens]XP_039275771.1 PI-PLC X domain-containing protein 1-like [Nilaparvata lugens]
MSHSFWILFVSVITSLTSVLSDGIQDSSAFCNKPQLEIWISSLPTKELVIYWNFAIDYPGGWIGIYSQAPIKDSSEHLVYKKIPLNETSGAVLTDVKLTGVILDTDLKFDSPTYLGYMAVAWKKNNGKDQAIVATQLQTYPQWMKHYWKYIKDVPMNEIFLPGTHDSCSYEGIMNSCDEDNSSNQLSTDITSKAKSFFDSTLRWLKKLPIIEDWSITQNENIREQLISGIRYLDVRVKKDSKGYWTTHGYITMEKLDVILAQVVEFVSNTEKEIVIIDIHQLQSGISSQQDHYDFVNYLKSKLTVNGREVWVNPNAIEGILWRATPEKIIENGKIIIAYPDNDFRDNHDLDILWPKVHQYWGNKQNIDDLRKYILENISERKNQGSYKYTLTAVMAQLTGNLRKILDNMSDGLSAQAVENCKKIHDLFLDADLSLDTNVLAVDFFRIMGVVRLAFIWNERIYYNTTCDPRQTYSDSYYQKILNP